MVTLITGASSGIGEEFSRRYAAKKHELVLVARRQDKLDALAEELREEHDVEVTTISLDLSEPDAAQRLWNETDRRGLHVDVLVNKRRLRHWEGMSPMTIPSAWSRRCASTVLRWWV